MQSRPQATAAGHVAQVGTQMSLEGTEGLRQSMKWCACDVSQVVGHRPLPPSLSRTFQVYAALNLSPEQGPGHGTSSPPNTLSHTKKTPDA